MGRSQHEWGKNDSYEGKERERRNLCAALGTFSMSGAGKLFFPFRPPTHGTHTNLRCMFVGSIIIIVRI